MSIIIAEDIRQSATIPCDFCDEFFGGRRNTFATRYAGQLSNRIVFTTPNFRVIPSMGQIVEGYLLVVPIRHFGTLADMADELIQELEAHRDRVREVLVATYGPCIFFEHGARSESSGGCGIYHAHLHAVPLGKEREPITVLKDSFNYKKLESITDIAGEANGTDSYLYYEDLHSNKYIFDVERLPSQYLRKLVAEAVGKEQWDWRKYGREEALLSTVARLARAFGTKTRSLQRHSVRSLR